MTQLLTMTAAEMIRYRIDVITYPANRAGTVLVCEDGQRWGWNGSMQRWESDGTFPAPRITFDKPWRS